MEHGVDASKSVAAETVAAAEVCAELGNAHGPYPCSPTCTHDDAATPGHPERVKERSEAFESTCSHLSPTFVSGGRCGECVAEAPVSPFRPSTEEDWELSLVEEALTEKPDSAISNGARHWRRRIVKIVAHLGWVDLETLKKRTSDARNEGAEVMRAAIRSEVLAILQDEGWAASGPSARILAAIEGAAPAARSGGADVHSR
jgi:hypothetical protein